MNSGMLISNVPPTNLTELIEKTYSNYDGNSSYANTLIATLKTYHFWPNIKVKKFKNNDDIVLLHNNYKMNDIYEYKELYEQCRSIVLDFTLSCNNNVVVTYANSIPRRISYEEYVSSPLYNATDKCYEAYDGTIITVYNYKNQWYFGTSSCPDANSSKFSHPTKSHGKMFDEVLEQFYSRNPEIVEKMSQVSPDDVSESLRAMFVSNLNPEHAYEFVLIHYENKHIIDYSDVLGENYKELVHINTKNRITLEEYDINEASIQELYNMGVRYPAYFADINQANLHINQNKSYGLIIKKKMEGENFSRLYKISSQYINYREETDPCHPNVWMNILSVYMKNKQNYTIKDYIATYNPNIQIPVDNNGRQIDPTYLVHTIISTIKDSLYSYYKSTTTYNPTYKRYKMNKEMDKQFAPIIQYHLAQLRNLQVTTFNKKLITCSNIYYYLCQCNDVKNIKTLIQFFASNPINEMQSRTSMCFAIMNTLIS
jgi:hypothetical protein